MRRTPLIVLGVVVAVLGLVLLLLNLPGGDGAEPGVTPDAGVNRTSSAAGPTEPTDATGSTSSPSEAAPEPTTTEAWLPPADAEPVAVRVDSVGIDHDLIPQGLAEDGTINPAQDEVIWFTGYDRVSPGQVGTAVIAGHVTYGDEPDAFVDLARVGEGDTVMIDYADGERLTADVVSTHLVDKQDLSHDPAVWGANDSTRRIVLITCDDALGHRDDGHNVANFVVIAEVAAS